MVDEYGGSRWPGVNVNGKLTLGENTADNGGVRVALMALRDTLGNKTGQRSAATRPSSVSSSPSARCGATTRATKRERLQVQTDPHSPAQFRVNGVVENMPEFQKAFSCKAGQPMTPVHACHVW